jgi:signal transduction histidine kinase
VKPRVLIVDDDAQNVLLLGEKMRADGYEVSEARTGIECLAAIDKYRPDIILMDVMMPEMDGYETLRRLKSREETRYIPVVMLTGMGEIEDRVRGFEVGADDYILKPFSLREVSARVKSLLRMRALQTKLVDSEKMAALGGMVDGIAHEIRNPLTTIGGMARRMLDPDTTAKHAEYADRIIRSVERLEKMLQRIDEYKRILSSTLVAGSINRVVESTVRDAHEFSMGKSINFTTKLMDNPPEISIDSVNLKIALFNIVQNAIEAIESKGEIIVETLPWSDQTFLIKITDDGVGMEGDQVRNIFSPFRTSKLEGAGLGLTISHRIVSDHGGDIRVESAPGAGTTVTVCMPLSNLSSNSNVDECVPVV